ncbi:polysaccharide biosynthesis/export family protein [Candidatus Hydrogenedentota bacterium]
MHRASGAMTIAAKLGLLTASVILYGCVSSGDRESGESAGFLWRTVDLPVDGTDAKAVSNVSVLPEDDGGEHGGKYRLGPADEIEVSVYGEPTLTKYLVIRPDGYISFPLAGEVEAEGQTVEAINRAITEKLSEFLKEPRVTVIVRQIRSKTYFVFGEVSNPGEYELTKPVSLVEAINIAGGYNQEPFSYGDNTSHMADLENILLIRKGKPGNKTFHFNLTDYLRGSEESRDAELRPHDVIYVPQQIRVVFVLGEVRSPGAYRIDSHASVASAVAAAGSYTDAASLKNVVLIRNEEGKRKYAKLNLKSALKSYRPEMDPVVVDRDVIYVPKSTIAEIDTLVQQYVAGLNPILTFYMDALNAASLHDHIRKTRDMQRLQIQRDEADRSRGYINRSLDLNP